MRWCWRAWWPRGSSSGVGALRAEAVAREHEAQRAIVSEAPVMIWRSGVDKGCDFFNPWWLTFTGRTLAQELGDGWAEGVHPDDLDACLASYVAAFDARVPFRLEYRLRRFDGEYRWVLDIGSPRYDSTAQFLGYIGCCFDITDRRQAEQALGEAHTEINRVSRLTALGEFAAALSHELRQPLTAIIMNACTTLDQLEKTPLDHEAMKEGLDDLVDAGHRAEAVIQRNRELFRHQTVQTSALDINAVVREVLILSATRLREHHVTVATALAADLPAVRGDRIELLQVLLNLLANAIDAMERVEKAARRITITTSTTGSGRRGRGGEGRRRRPRSRGHATDVHALVHDEGGGHRRRPLHQPLDHPGARRPHLGGTERGPRRDVFVLGAGVPASRLLDVTRGRLAA